MVPTRALALTLLFCFACRPTASPDASPDHPLAVRVLGRRHIRSCTSLTAFALSRDGAQIAVGDRDGHIWLWPWGLEGRPVALGDGGMAITSLAFFPASNRLASGEHGGMLRIWDLSTLSETDSISCGNYSVQQILLAPAEDRLAVNVAGALELVDLDAARVTEVGRAGLCSDSNLVLAPEGCCAAYTAPDDSFCAYGGGILPDLPPPAVRFIDMRTGEVRRQIPWAAPPQRDGPVRLSPGAELAAAAAEGAGALLWVPGTTEPLRTLGDGYVWVCAFSPDGSLVACDGEISTQIVCTATGEALYRIEATQPAFSGDGRTLAALGTSARNVCLWDAALGAPLCAREGHHGEVRGVAFSPDGTRLATGSADGTVRIWDLTAGQERVLWTDECRDMVADMAWAPDGTMAALFDGGSLEVWEGTGSPPVGLRTAPHGGRHAAFWPGGRIAVEGEQGWFGVMDVESRRWWRVLGDGTAGAIACSPADGLVAAAQEGGQVALWDPASSARVATLDVGEEAAALAVSPDGATLAVAGEDGSLTLWDLRGGGGAAALATGGAGLQASALAFSPDGRMLAEGAAGDPHGSVTGIVRIWDVGERRLAREVDLSPDWDWPLDVAFSPDGRTVAVGTGRGVVLLVEAPEVR